MSPCTARDTRRDMARATGRGGRNPTHIRHPAQILRRLSHPLDTRYAPGGGSEPCAPEFSYLESASAEQGHLPSPADLTGALPSLALRHEGFFVALAHVVPLSHSPHRPSSEKRM